MTEEEKQAALEAEAKAKADAKAAEDAEFEATLEGLSDEEKAEKIAEREAQHNDNKIDYEAELAKEREAREKAEKALADKRFKEAERKRKEGSGDDDETKPLTKAELRELLAEERQATQKEVRSVRAEEIAKGLTGSEAEKNLVLEIFKNRTFPPHLSLEEQLEESYVIANRKKLVGERNEALRALKGKDGVNKDAAGTHHDAPPGKEPQLSAQDKAAVTAVGVVWNATSKRYEKKLKSGKILVWDVKNKQTYLV